MQRYTVQPGDTLFLIAQRFGKTIQELMRANNSINPDILKIGQKLIIPTHRDHPQSWVQINRIFGKEGIEIDNVLKFTFPRYDLKVNIGPIVLEPELALTSWSAFHQMESHSMMMGDLVLQENEVYPVISKLKEVGLEVTALHNHLLWETPRIMYLHVEGIGHLINLADGVKSALALTSTPLFDIRSRYQIPFDWTTVEAIIGQKGQKQGRVLMLSIPRHKPVFENGMEIPPAMGLNHVINIQAERKNVATTGDFVLLAKQVNPVVRVLTENNITVTAVHNHMLKESPRLFFLHFWGLDEPNVIASGLRRALKQT
jgi:LysM repeat protein